MMLMALGDLTANAGGVPRPVATATETPEGDTRADERSSSAQSYCSMTPAAGAWVAGRTCRDQGDWRRSGIDEIGLR